MCIASSNPRALTGVHMNNIYIYIIHISLSLYIYIYISFGVSSQSLYERRCLRFLSRAKRSHAGNRHLRNRRGLSVAFSDGWTFRGIFRRSFNCQLHVPKDCHLPSGCSLELSNGCSVARSYGCSLS